MSLTRLLLAALGLALAGACRPDHAPATAAPPAPPATAVPTPLPDSAARALSPALHRLIRQQVARINAVRKWSSTETQPVESGEGGETTYYELNGQLLKVTTHQLGENGQALTEYYLLNGQPAFVFEQFTSYNRPIYYDAAAMRENHDTEAFDPAKSTVTATRSYFDAAGRLVAQTGPAARDSASTSGYLIREQHRLRTDLDSLRRAGPTNNPLRPSHLPTQLFAPSVGAAADARGHTTSLMRRVAEG